MAAGPYVRYRAQKGGGGIADPQGLDRRFFSCANPAKGHNRTQARASLRWSPNRKLPAGADLERGSGLFCGGTQRTALLIRQSNQRQPVIRSRRLIDALGKSRIRAASRKAGRRQESPVKGRPVRLAPLQARRQVRRSVAWHRDRRTRPTGALCQPGFRVKRTCARNSGQAAGRADQLRSGFGYGNGVTPFSVFEIVVIGPWRHGGPARCRNCGRMMTRVSPRGGTLGDGSRPSLDCRSNEESVKTSAWRRNSSSDHRRLAGNRRDHRDAERRGAALPRTSEREIAVRRRNSNHLVDMLGPVSIASTAEPRYPCCP